MQSMLKRLAITAGFVAMGAAPLFGTAQAADWPEGIKVVKIIVPAPGGAGTGDSIARIMGDALSDTLDTTFIIDNKGGANGNIGAGLAAKAKPDGETLLFSWAGTLSVNPSLYSRLSFDPATDFDPVALVADVPNILVVNKDLPITNLEEFIAYAKENPDKINFGSTGNGSSMHLAGELFMRETGTKMVHVPYAAPGQATTNMIANEIQAMFQLIPGIIGQIQADRVRPIAIMSEERSAVLPDVPTMKELGHPELMSSTWFAMLVPTGTAPETVQKLNKTLNDILENSETGKRLENLGAHPLGGSPEDLREHMAEERVKWGKVIEEAGIPKL